MHIPTQHERNHGGAGEARNAFYILVAPDKNTIYPEKLPDYPRGAVTRIDQLAARVRSSDLALIDPREQLLRVEFAERYLRVTPLKPMGF